MVGSCLESQPLKIEAKGPHSEFKTSPRDTGEQKQQQQQNVCESYILCRETLAWDFQKMIHEFLIGRADEHGVEFPEVRGLGGNIRSGLSEVTHV